ncbi:hypothetical protein ACC755_22755 [Rhizobium ruizarguesonis]
MKIGMKILCFTILSACATETYAKDGCFDFSKLNTGTLSDPYYAKVNGGYFVMRLFGVAGNKEPMIVDWGNMRGLLAETVMAYATGKTKNAKVYLSNKGSITYSSPEGSATDNFQQVYATEKTFDIIKSEKLPASPKFYTYAFSAPNGKKFDVLHITGTLVSKLCLNRAGKYSSGLDVDNVVSNLRH